MRIKKIINSPWGISIGTAIFTIFFTIFLDLVMSKPVLSTLGSLGVSVWGLILTVLNFELKVWWLIVIVGVVIMIIQVIAKVTEKAPARPPFLSYKSDTFKNWKWSWEWDTGYNKKWRVTELTAYCPKCGHSLLKAQDFIYDYSFQCPMCNFYSRGESEEHPAKIERLILDRVKQF